ncbi:MAG: four helix bundle protein [Parcubacteria group bacterium]|jgi:hypothetical protein
MLKPSRQPYGFKNLLAYKKAEELQMECSRLTAQFPKQKTLIALADQMDRSARSTKQNIVEGWKRNSTKEYYDFLGFSIGANTELEEDCNDVWRGAYPGLMGIRGVMGEVKGEKGLMGEGEIMNKRDVMGEKGIMEGSPSSPGLSPLTLLNPLILLDIEKIPFYPLDRNLPPIIQLKLRCKELNYLLYKLQKALENKMRQEKTLSVGDMARDRLQEMDNNKKHGADFLEEYGLKQLENGQVVAKE